MNTKTYGDKTVVGRTDVGGGRRRSLWKGPAFITAILLLIPVLGNRVVVGWNWELPAFVRVGTLVFGLGLTYQLVTRNVNTIAYRAAVGIAIVAAFLLVWVNFIQGNADDGVNPAAFKYFWVPLVGIIGAAMARFQPKGMARALFATALAQALVLAIVLTTRNPEVTPWSAAVARGFGLNAFFLMLFVGSALLFRTAAHGESAPGAV